MRVLAAVLLALSVSTTSAAPPTQSWAVVSTSGTLMRGHNAISARQLGADGTYEVVFDHDVSQCVYVVSGGELGATGPDDGVIIGANERYGVPNAVAVIEYDALLGRDSYSAGFHLLVQC